jgi:hypothetical protein
MPTISDLVADKSTVEVNFGGTVLTVSYNMSLLTRERTIFTNDESIVHFLTDLITDWDLTEMRTNGKTAPKEVPVPITEASLNKIPTPIIFAIYRAIMGADISLGEANGNSPAG